MSKFHINKHGVPAPCKATKGNCPLGGEGEHFSKLSEAQDFADKENESKYGLLGGVSESNSATLDVSSDRAQPNHNIKDEVKSHEKASAYDEKISSFAKEDMDTLYNKLVKANEKIALTKSSFLRRNRSPEENALREIERIGSETYRKGPSNSEVYANSKEFWIEDKKGNVQLRDDFKVDNEVQAKLILKDNGVLIERELTRNGERLYSIPGRSENNIKLEHIIDTEGLVDLANNKVKEMRDSDIDDKEHTLKFYQYVTDKYKQ